MFDSRTADKRGLPSGRAVPMLAPQGRSFPGWSFRITRRLIRHVRYRFPGFHLATRLPDESRPPRLIASRPLW